MMAGLRAVLAALLLLQAGCAYGLSSAIGHSQGTEQGTTRAEEPEAVLRCGGAPCAELTYTRDWKDQNPAWPLAVILPVELVGGSVGGVSLFLSRNLVAGIAVMVATVALESTDLLLTLMGSGPRTYGPPRFTATPTIEYRGRLLGPDASGAVMGSLVKRGGGGALPQTFSVVELLRGAKVLAVAPPPLSPSPTPLPPPPPATSGSSPRRASAPQQVVVLGFRADSGAVDAAALVRLGTALRERAEAAGTNLTFQTAPAACEECTVEAGRAAGGALVISGSVVRFGTKLKLSLQLHQTKDGKLLSAAVASGATEPLVVEDLPRALGELLAPAR